MRVVIFAVFSVLLFASCTSRKEKVCERSYEVLCPKDKNVVVKFTVKMDIDEDMSVPCGQYVCNELADWTKTELENVFCYLLDDEDTQHDVQGFAYKSGTGYSDIIDYYAKILCDGIKASLTECACESLPYGPITLNLEMKKVWSDDSLSTYMVYHDWDYSGSCGATFLTKYQTIDHATGRILGLKDFVPSVRESDLEDAVYTALMAEKDSRGVYIEDEMEETVSSHLYFLDNDIELDDIVSLRGDTLVFMFPPYSVGCGAEGDYEVKLPRKSFN